MEKRKVGRPRREYSEDIAEQICERIAKGETLRSISKDKSLPDRHIVYRWIDENPEFASRFALARHCGYDEIADEMLEIANSTIIGETEEISYGPDGMHKKVKREDMLGHRKLQVWTREKLLSKWYPQKYGEKIQQEITGKDGGPLRLDKASELTDEQLEQLILSNAKSK